MGFLLFPPRSHVRALWACDDFVLVRRELVSVLSTVVLLVVRKLPLSSGRLLEASSNVCAFGVFS